MPDLIGLTLADRAWAAFGAGSNCTLHFADLSGAADVAGSC